MIVSVWDGRKTHRTYDGERFEEQAKTKKRVESFGKSLGVLWGGGEGRKAINVENRMVYGNKNQLQRENDLVCW